MPDKLTRAIEAQELVVTEAYVAYQDALRILHAYQEADRIRPFRAPSSGIVTDFRFKSFRRPALLASLDAGRPGVEREE